MIACLSLSEKVDLAIARMRDLLPGEEQYFLADSGGKDSRVLHHLAHLGDIPHDAHYQRTSVDPPELYRFVRSFGAEIVVDKPLVTMWELIIEKLFAPVSQARWCCEHLKEYGGEGRIVLTGVRWSESNTRAKRRKMTEFWEPQNKVVVNPIIDWTTADVWELIRRDDLPYCSLYNEGFKRLGCILCPQQGSAGMLRDARRWPGYARAYIRTFDRVVELRKAEGMECTWSNGQEMFDWWVAPRKRNPKEDTEPCLIYQ